MYCYNITCCCRIRARLSTSYLEINKQAKLAVVNIIVHACNIKEDDLVSKQKQTTKKEIKYDTIDSPNSSSNRVACRGGKIVFATAMLAFKESLLTTV